MKASDDDFRVRLESEFQRLGLRWEEMPGGGLMVSGSDALDGFIARLRTLRPGATWRDVFPDIPAHWEPGRPETWTAPYRPLGPYDYQDLPTGPALTVRWRIGGPERLEEFIGAARSAGWRVYGAGLLPRADVPEVPCHAIVVLERGTTEDDLHVFGTWIDRHPDFALAGFIRLGTERYLDG